MNPSRVNPFKETRFVRDSLPSPVKDVIEESFLSDTESLESRCKAILDESSWSRAQNWFKWILAVVPDAHDAIKYVEDRVNDQIRRSKGCGSKPKNPGGLLRSKLVELAQSHGIEIKTHYQANLWIEYRMNVDY